MTWNWGCLFLTSGYGNCCVNDNFALRSVNELNVDCRYATTIMTKHIRQKGPQLGLLAAADVSQMLQVSEQTLSRWARLRRGPPRVKIGRKIFYRSEALEDWILSCEELSERCKAVQL